MRKASKRNFDLSKLQVSSIDLAVSDVGIAMSGGGVDIALEEVVLVNDELIQILHLIRLSSKTVEVAKQNIMALLAIKMLLATGIGKSCPALVYCCFRR